MVGELCGAPRTLSFYPVTTASPPLKHLSTSYHPQRRIRVTASKSSSATTVDGGKPHKIDHGNSRSKSRVFFLDVNPLCYTGAKPSLHSFAHWLSLFFSQVSVHDPVIAVLDGENGNEYRRQLLPSYKAHRKRLVGQRLAPRGFSRGFKVGPPLAESRIKNVLRQCNVPVVKVDGYEADDVIATLANQVLQRGLRVVIGSPDKDFKQLISEDVQIVMPMSEFGRWSFYTLRHYIAQYNCNPTSDLSLREYDSDLELIERCIMGDEVDGVPGIQHFVPGFGRKTALKLIKKHGSLENLLNAAAIKTVGRQYAQDALTNHADYLRKNYEVLSLRRDADVQLNEAWFTKRGTSNDSIALSNFVNMLGGSQNDNKYEMCG